MKQLDIKGTNTNAIISSFRKEHHIKDWELQYDIISEASNGLFGIFGKKQAHIRFKLLSTEERIKLFVEQLLKHMDIRFDKIEARKEQKTVFITIGKSSDAGFLIGKNGSMLEQLQYLVNRVFENVRDLERIYLDTEEYRQRQEQTFLRNYIALINKVKATGKPVTLEPMQGSERRIIHKYVEGEKDLKTLTIGEGDNKRIVIMPANQKEQDVLKKQPELTPTQRAERSYKRHNSAHPNTRPSQRPRRPERDKTRSQ